MQHLLSEHALEQLGLATVSISAPSGFGGSYWNPGEYALVKVRVTNSTGVPLRDVVASLRVTGRASVAPFPFLPGLYDAEGYWKELEPGQSEVYWVRLRASSNMEGGTVTMRASVCADIVPYVCRDLASRTAAVQQAYV